MRMRHNSLPSRAFYLHRCVSLALLGAGAAYGTFGARAALADATAEQGSQGPLQEIVVTATRRDESLSKVPISVTAFTQESLDERGIKDFNDVARFTPGVNVDNSGTNNISIRGIASSGGAGTTGIYLDDTPIQMRALAFNPDEALPKTFDIDRVEVLRGPQGTLFGAGSEGGTVRYITTQPSLTKSSVYSRDEVSYTQGGDPSYEAGVAAGTPIIDGTLGIRASVWYRRDGGYVDLVDPTTLGTVQKNANYDQTSLFRLAAVWAPADGWTVTPSIYYQDRYRNNVEAYWPLYSNPSSDRFVSADPDRRSAPDRFYLTAMKVEGDVGFAKLIENTSYYHRKEETGYEGTIYNLGFYQRSVFVSTLPNGSAGPAGSGILPGLYPLIDGNGIHLPPGATDYRSPASIDNGQQNIVEEVRLQSKDSASPLVWTTGLFFAANRQSYLEQIHDPNLNQLSLAATGQPYTNWFYDVSQPTFPPVTYDPRFPNDSYFLQTESEDKQYALYGEGSYAFTDQWKLTLGARYSRLEYSFNTLTGGPQLFLSPQTGTGDKKESSFTPKVSVDYQYDSRNLYYFTYAKGFRPGGANNPVPQAACGTDFQNFGISAAPQTYGSDTVNSFEVGAKNNIDNWIKLASSVYYIRWNNIQQTVVPPICQISFIANLGQATAKGLDLQADVAVSDAFTVELAAGYTDARYTQDSRLSAVEAQPLVSSGDAISGQSGQPNPPITVTVGLQYKFALLGRDSYVRFDDEYQSAPKWRGASQDAATLQYDPANYLLSSTNFASLRAGMQFGGWQVSPFVDNLFDTHTVTNYNWSIDPGDGNSRLQRQFTFRPRTFGLTFTYRN